jgi:hypothetical protein
VLSTTGWRDTQVRPCARLVFAAGSNIADYGDIVAIPKGGISRAFLDLTSDITDNIHAFDFHRVTHYLACPATTGVLAAMT